MSEGALNILAIGIEVGIPIMLVIASVLFDRFRKYGLVILGACSVWLFLYAAISIDYWFGISESAFAYYAVWVMTLGPFLATVLIIGMLSIVLSKLPNNWSRYLGGVLPTLLVLGGLVLCQRWAS